MKSRFFMPLATYPEAASEASVANGVAVCKLLGATLDIVALNVEIPKVSSALSRVLLDVPEMIRDAEKLSAETGSHLLTVAKAKADASGVAVSAGTAKTPPTLAGELAASKARYFDGALVGLRPDNASTRMVAEAVIFGSGKPTVLLPDAKSVERLDSVAIAWDGSRVAARSVSDARFLLERAASIHVITVTDEKPLKEKDAGERLAASLRQAGLKAEFAAIRAEDAPIADTLQHHAARMGADLLVMGGYGHSRLRDFVLGGATEGVLTDLKLPVLLSH